MTTERTTRGAFSPEWLERYRVDPEVLGKVELVGIGHVVAELDAVASRLLEPERAERFGLTPPRGILLYGGPGLGKTISARYFAASLGDGVALYEPPPDDLTPERLRGLVRHLGEQGGQSVVYLDEVDAFALHRGLDAHTPATRALLMAALSVLDGLVPRRRVVFVASSNRPPSHLDPAIVRAGRFDLSIALVHPDEPERLELLRHFAKDLPIAVDVDLASIAEQTRGTTPADLRGCLADAAALAFRDGRSRIDAVSVRTAVERRGLVFPDREPAEIPADEKRRFAIHEAGHVIVAAALCGAAHVKRVSIDADGGDTEIGKREPSTEATARKDLAIAYAGLFAERALLGDASTGSSDDMHRIRRVLMAGIEAGHSDSAMPFDLAELRHRPPARWLELLAEDVERQLTEARATSLRIVREQVGAIDRFATRLAAAGELSGPELHEAIAIATGRQDEGGARADATTGAGAPEVRPVARRADR